MASNEFTAYFKCYHAEQELIEEGFDREGSYQISSNQIGIKTLPTNGRVRKRGDFFAAAKESKEETERTGRIRRRLLSAFCPEDGEAIEESDLPLEDRSSAALESMARTPLFRKIEQDRAHGSLLLMLLKSRLLWHAALQVW